MTSFSRIALTTVAAGLAFWAQEAAAHHSAAMYDASKTVELDGTLKKAQIGNPHSWFYVMVPNAQGGADLWAFEGGSVAQLQRDSSVGNDALATGQKVKVSFHPLKDGRPSGELLSMTLENGKVLGSGSEVRPPAGPGPGSAP